ncbi:MAG TPA: polyphosphate kinase 1, partial [Ktedonobacterales bacterium]
TLASGAEAGPDGLLRAEQVAVLRPEIHATFSAQIQRLRDVLLPALAERGIAILDYRDLARGQRAAAASYFRDEIFPVLTPLAVDPGHPFPHISNRSLNLAVTLRDAAVGELFARIKVPSILRRLVPVPLSGHERRHHLNTPGKPAHTAYVWLEQVIAAHLEDLFPGVIIASAYPFRVLRDADIEIVEEEADDLLETVEQGLRRRRFAEVVNLSVRADMPEALRSLLCAYLETSRDNLFALDGPLGLGDLMELVELDRPDLKDPALVPHVPPQLRLGRDPFAAIQQGDMLLHHPYDAFSSVADFIETAARDPQVLAIKQTLYRVGSNSPIVQALLDANDRGKQVAVAVEIKARFDEESNIEWARTLESAGVHVVYGHVSLKTHAKVALVVRREADGLRGYVHLGTGNYNATTARTYEDFALLTCRPEFSADASNLFNALTGYARGVRYNKLLVAPDYLRAGLLARIQREIDRQASGGGGRLIFKVNSLVDVEIIRALYRASQAGVRIDLIVRGICCLRPGVPGVSDNIRVISIVGRYLEHSRIYYFGNGGKDRDEIFLGSADLMPRNLDRRVEVLFPIEDVGLRGYLRDIVLPHYLSDTVNARSLERDGEYHRLPAPKGQEPDDVQTWFARATAARDIIALPARAHPKAAAPQ